MANAASGRANKDAPYDPYKSILVDILMDAIKENDIDWLESDQGRRWLDFTTLDPDYVIDALRDRQNGNGHD